MTEAEIAHAWTCRAIGPINAECFKEVLPTNLHKLLQLGVDQLRARKLPESAVQSFVRWVNQTKTHELKADGTLDASGLARYGIQAHRTSFEYPTCFAFQVNIAPTAATTKDPTEYLLARIAKTLAPFGFELEKSPASSSPFDHLPYNLSREAARAVIADAAHLKSTPPQPIPAWIVTYLDYLENVR